MVHKAVSHYIKLKDSLIADPGPVCFSYTKCPTLITTVSSHIDSPLEFLVSLNLNSSSLTTFVIKNLFNTSSLAISLIRKITKYLSYNGCRTFSVCVHLSVHV